MWRRVAAYALFVAGLLTIIFFRGYNGRLIPHPMFFYLLGFALAAAGVLLIATMPLWRKRKEQRHTTSKEDELRRDGIALKVNLSACEIKQHFYRENAEKADGTGFPEAIGDIDRYTPAWKDSQKQEVYQCVLVYDCVFNGQPHRFVSAVIAKDKATLGFLLDNHKETVVYVDKNNADRYYFDVGFLYE